MSASPFFSIATRVVPSGTFEAELHVLGGDGVAVVKFEIAARLELVYQPVSALRPRLGEARGHLALSGQGPPQGVVEGEEHPERCDLGRGGRRVEPRRGDGDVPGNEDR